MNEWMFEWMNKWMFEYMNIHTSMQTSYVLNCISRSTCKFKIKYKNIKTQSRSTACFVREHTMPIQKVHAQQYNTTIQQWQNGTLQNANGSGWGWDSVAIGFQPVSRASLMDMYIVILIASLERGRVSN